MAASLQNRIEDYIGPNHSGMELTDWVTALSQWLTASAKELFDIIPEMTLKRVAPATISSAIAGTGLSGKRIFGVDVAGYPAREVPSTEYAKLKNSNSIHYALSSDPVFYIESGKLFVIMSGGVTDAGTIHYISAPEVTYDLTTVPYFPTEYEPLVVLGAAVRGKMRQMVDTRSTLPSPLDLSSVTIPTAPSVPVFSYENATASNIAAQTVTITGVAPSYTAPVALLTSFSDYWPLSDFSDSDPGVLTISATPPSVPPGPIFSVPDITTVTVGAISGAPDYDNTIVNTELSELATLIDTEEDPELAQAKVGQIQAIISNELNEFNQEQVAYQTSVSSSQQDAQTAAQEAQTEGNLTLQSEYQEYSSIIQRYSSELQAYQADVGKEVQEYTQRLQRYQLELGAVQQAWQTERTTDLQKYGSDVQNNLNVFQEESTEYQAKLQVNLQDAQQAQRAIEADAQLETDVDKTNKLQALQKEIQEYTAEVQRYSSRVQAYSSEVGTLVQEYSNKIQGVTADHSLMMQELQGLQGLYQQELQLLMGGQQSGG